MHNKKHGMLRNDVYQKLKDLIINENYKIGQALTESKITNELGVSRTPVREAFAQLENDGLVEIIPNKGAVVRGLTKNDIKDMYDIRSYIESISVKNACANIKIEEMAEIRQTLKLEKIFLDNRDFLQFLQSDYDFHYGIIKAGNSRIFQKMISSMMEYTKSARKNSLSFGTRAKEAYKEHMDIYDAITKRDTELASELMEKHIMNAKDSFIKNIFEKENVEYG